MAFARLLSRKIILGIEPRVAVFCRRSNVEAWPEGIPPTEDADNELWSWYFRRPVGPVIFEDQAG